jgi:hypothetical protein
MQRLALVATLKEGAEPRALELIKRGPPFDPAERGFDGHTVFLSAQEVVFVFEGEEVEWHLDDLVEEAGAVRAAFFEWRELVADEPRIARAVYTWGRDSDE